MVSIPNLRNPFDEKKREKQAVAFQAPFKFKIKKEESTYTRHPIVPACEDVKSPLSIERLHDEYFSEGTNSRIETESATKSKKSTVFGSKGKPKNDLKSKELKGEDKPMHLF